MFSLLEVITLNNWTTRVRMMNANGPFWLSMPVRRTSKGLQKIKELKTDNSDHRWLKKMTKTIEQTYRMTPFYADVIPPIIEILTETQALCVAQIFT